MTSHIQHDTGNGAHSIPANANKMNMFSFVLMLFLYLGVHLIHHQLSYFLSTRFVYLI